MASRGDNLEYPVYQFAGYLTRLRYYAERAYANPWRGDPEAGPPDADIPPVIGDCLGMLEQLATEFGLRAKAQEGIRVAADGVVAEVSQVVNTLGQCWLNADHRERARRRLTWDEYEVGDWAVLMGMIEGSPVGPEAWTRVEEAAARFEAALSEDLAAVYRLGRLLAGAKNPTSRDYNREAGCYPVYDRRYVLGRLWPEIQSLLRQASVRVPGLATGPARIEADGDPYDDLKPVEDHILTCLRSYTAGEPPRPQEPPPCEPVTEPAPVGLQGRCRKSACCRYVNTSRVTPTSTRPCWRPRSGWRRSRGWSTSAAAWPC